MNAGTIDEILRFWFETLKPEDWYRRNPAIDAEIVKRFGPVYEALSTSVPQDWLAEPRGMLAAILVLDQFPLNMFRDDPRAFATDQAALTLSKRAIGEGLDLRLPPEQRADQARSIEIFTSLGAPLNLDFARRHEAIIARFGRFPHRNAVLGRESTEDEIAFLKEPGSSF